jgi:hypothetical protein
VRFRAQRLAEEILVDPRDARIFVGFPQFHPPVFG